jgi:hypothetical protein
MLFWQAQGDKTGQITVKYAALGAFAENMCNRMFCMMENQKHNMQVQPDDFWMFLVISEK